MARIQTALTPTQLNQKRGTAWRGTQYISISRPTLVFQATVDQSTFAEAFAEVTYSAVSGSYSAVKAGMTVQIGDHFIGRVRKIPTQDQLFINESSAPLRYGDVIRVWEDYRAWGILGRMVAGVETIDWDQPYQGLRPMIRNLASVRVGWVSVSTDNKLQLTLSPTAYPAEVGAMINNSSWSWELPTGVTLQAGSLTQPNITVRCEAGGYWLTVSVSDTGGRRSTRHVKVFAHSEAYPPETRMDSISVEGTLENGINATIPAFVGLEDLPDQTLVTVWTEADYDGVAVAPRIDAHGRIMRLSSGAEGDFQYHTLRQDVSAQVNGVGGQMGQIEAPKIALRDSPAPTVWGEITRPTVWRAVWHILDRYTTLTTLHEIAFDDLSEQYLHPSPFAVSGGQLLSAVNQLLSALNAGLQFAPDGVIECVRDGRWLSMGARDSLGVVASWDEHDALSYDAEHGSGGNVGFVQAFGASWNNHTQTITPFSAIAPGVAFGEGNTSVSLNEQVLRSNVSAHIAQAELTERTAHEYAYRNAGDGLTVNLPDGYSDLIPARNIWHAWTLSELYATGKRWLLTRLTYCHDNETGTRDVQATFEPETFGVGGQSLVLPASDGVENIIPTFPPFDVYPAFPEMPNVVFPSNDPIHIPPVTVSPIAPAVPPRDGNRVLTWNKDDLWLTHSYKISKTPLWERVTPPLDADEIITDASFGKEVEAFALTYNRLTEQSRVWRCDNIFVGWGKWQAGKWVGGEFKTLRVASAPQTLYLTGQTSEPPIPTEWEHEVDFTTGQHDWVINRDTPAGSLTYVAGQGFRFVSPNAGSIWDERILLNLSPRPTLNTDNTVEFVEAWITHRNNSIPVTMYVGDSVDGLMTIPAGTMDLFVSRSASMGFSNLIYVGVTGIRPPVDESFTISRLKLRGTGINPFEMEPNWTQVFDFTQSAHGFEVTQETGGVFEHVSGQGWRQTVTVRYPSASSSRTVITRSMDTIPRDDYIFYRIITQSRRSTKHNYNRHPSMQTGSYTLGLGTVVAGTDGDTVHVREVGPWILSRGDISPLSITIAIPTSTTTIPDPRGDWFLIEKITIEGIGVSGMGNPFAPPSSALLGYSADDGETVTHHEIGNPPLLGVIGLDPVTIGNRAYVGLAGDILQAEEGDEPTLYASLPVGLGVAGGLIVSPRHKFDGSSNAVDEPDLIVGSPVLTGDDEALWQVTDEGDTLTDITPELSGHYGVIASPNSLAVSWNDSAKIALIAVIDDEKHLLTWDGSAWVDRGVLGDDADYVRMRKQDQAGRELYFIDGDCYYSADYGVTLQPRQAPDEDMKGISIYG